MALWAFFRGFAVEKKSRLIGLKCYEKGIRKTLTVNFFRRIRCGLLLVQKYIMLWTTVLQRVIMLTAVPYLKARQSAGGFAVVNGVNG